MFCHYSHVTDWHRAIGMVSESAVAKLLQGLKALVLRCRAAAAVSPLQGG